MLAELAPRGRSAFFYEDWGHFWFSSDRSGVVPGYTPLVLWFGLPLPLLLRFREPFPLLARVRGTSVLLHLLLSSLGSFLLAHLWLFRLHLPSRYTHHSLRVLLSLAAGLVLVAIAPVGVPSLNARRRYPPATLLHPHPTPIGHRLAVRLTGFFPNGLLRRNRSERL